MPSATAAVASTHDRSILVTRQPVDVRLQSMELLQCEIAERSQVAPLSPDRAMPGERVLACHAG
jgi:hypothetical protein